MPHAQPRGQIADLRDHRTAADLLSAYPTCADLERTYAGLETGDSYAESVFENADLSNSDRRQ